MNIHHVPGFVIAHRDVSLQSRIEAEVIHFKAQAHQLRVETRGFVAPLDRNTLPNL